MGRLRAALERSAGPRAGAVVLATVVLLLADQALRRVGGVGVAAGILDETTHVMTGLLVLAALFRGASAAFAAGLVAGSLLIDVDHIPQYLGVRILTAGTDRPDTHSLLTLALIATATFIWRKRRAILLGILVGLAGHFTRDLAESQSGVPLLWPFSYRSFTTPHWIYLVAVGLLALIAIGRVARTLQSRRIDLRQVRRHRSAVPRDARAGAR